MCEEGRLGFRCCKIEFKESVERRLKEGRLGHQQALEEGETQAKVKRSLEGPETAHVYGRSNFCRGRKFQTYSGGQNFVVGGQSCTSGRDLTGFDLDRGSISSCWSDLVLEGY